MEVACQHFVVSSTSVYTFLLLWTLSSCDNYNYTDHNRGPAEPAYFPQFSISVLQEHILSSRHLPLCVMYTTHGVASDLERQLSKVWEHRTPEDKISSWIIARFIVDQVISPPIALPSHVPALRCYLGLAKPQDFYHQSQNAPACSLKKWLKKLVEKFGGQLPEATLVGMTDSSQHHELTLLGISTRQSHHQLEEILSQVQVTWREQVHVLFLHPDTNHSREITAHLRITNKPCVIAFGKSSSKELRVLRIFKSTELTRTSLDLYLTLRNIPVISLTKNNFDDLVMKRSKHYVPMLVLFYTWTCPGILDHVRAYEQTRRHLEGQGVSMRYGLVEINTSNTYIIETSVKFGYTTKFPFTVLFTAKWLKNTVVGIDQTLLRDRPTLGYFMETISTNNIVLNSTSGGQILLSAPWGYSDITQMSLLYEGPYGTMCGVHASNTTDNNPHSRVLTKIKKPKKQKSWHEMFSSEEIDMKLERVGTLPLVTEVTWQEVVGKSHVPQHPYNPGGRWAGERTKVTLIIFIIADCSSCRRNMATFEEIQKTVRYVGGSVYVVNCTGEESLCTQQSITGFPTLVAFRGLGWMHGRGCMSDLAMTREGYIRMDYHGVLLVPQVMEWFSKITNQAVTNLGFQNLDSHDEDFSVALLGTLLPRSSSYLPRIAARRTDYFYPYDCFRLACERLYGQAGCFVKYSAHVPQSQFMGEDKAMVVTQVSLIRKDGLETVITQLGRTLFSTVGEEATTNPHKFHKPHRYDLGVQQKCEDNHAQCTDLLVDFTRDHRRLPITHMSTQAFHTQNSLIFQGNLPVLVALIHKENITENSPFHQLLLRVAEEMYNEMVTVSVDVDQFPAWAGQFVPQGGRHKFKEEEDHKFYSYPRLCVVRWDDHEHAAFIPPLKVTGNGFKVTAGLSFTEGTASMIQNDLLNFLQQYLKDPADFIVQTEHF